MNSAPKISVVMSTYNRENYIKKSVAWYKHFYQKDTKMYEFTMEQIKNYEDRIQWEQ